MSGKNKVSKLDNKRAFAVVAIVLCLTFSAVAVMYSQMPKKDQTSNESQTNKQMSTKSEQKTRIEYLVKVTTSGPHFGVVVVSDEDDTIVCEEEFRNDDEATVTNKYKINAGVGDKVTVEVQFGGYVTVRLVKEGFLLSKTIASKTDYDGIIFRYTIKEDDI